MKKRFTDRPTWRPSRRDFRRNQRPSTRSSSKNDAKNKNEKTKIWKKEKAGSMCHLWPAFGSKEEERNTLNITKRGRRRRASAFRHQVRLTVKEVISLRTLSLSLWCCAGQTFERKKERIRIPFIASPIHVFSLPRSLLPPSGKDTHSPEMSVILYIHLPPIGTKKRKISLNNQHTQEKEKDKILQWPSPVSFFFVERFHLRNFFLIFLAGCRTSFYDRNFSLSLSPSIPPSVGVRYTCCVTLE